MDPSRPIHYEGKNEVADIDSHMYPSLSRMAAFDQMPSDKPYFLCEYVHSMENAMGNLAEYWDYIENNSQRIIGACVWDWIDQAHTKTGEPDNHYYYGGDYGDVPNDVDFSCNGLIKPDRKVTAKLIKLKRIYQYIKFKPLALAAGKIEIENKYDFLNLDQFDISFTILRDGIPVEEGMLASLSLAPDEKVIVEIPFKRSYDAGKEYFLNMSVKLKNKTNWADKGYEVASTQFALTPRSVVAKIEEATLPTIDLKANGEEVTITGTGFNMVFNQNTGVITSLKYDGVEYLYNQKGLELNWYRSVGNDKFTDQNYYPVTEKKPICIYTVAEDKKSVTIISDHVATINSPTPVTLPYLVKYTIYGNGIIDVEASFTKPSDGAIIHRLGLQMQLPPGFESVTYYGKGPHENYIDRIKSADVGLYSTTPKGMEEERYIRAQSLGNREDIRWIGVTNNRNQGLKVISKNRLSFSALHFSDRALWEATHDFNLDKIREPQVYLNLDCIQ